MGLKSSAAKWYIERKVNAMGFFGVFKTKTAQAGAAGAVASGASLLALAAFYLAGDAASLAKLGLTHEEAVSAMVLAGWALVQSLAAIFQRRATQKSASLEQLLEGASPETVKLVTDLAKARIAKEKQ